MSPLGIGPSWSKKREVPSPLIFQFFCLSEEFACHGFCLNVNVVAKKGQHIRIQDGYTDSLVPKLAQLLGFLLLLESTVQRHS